MLHRRFSLKVNFLLLFVPLALLIAGSVLFYGHTEIKRQIDKELHAESNELKLSEQSLDQTLSSLARDVHFLGALPNLLNAADDPSTNNISLLTDTLSTFMQNYGIYDQLRWLDASGMERLRINRNRITGQIYVSPKQELQDKSDRYYFIETKNLAGYLCPSPRKGKSFHVEIKA